MNKSTTELEDALTADNAELVDLSKLDSWRQKLSDKAKQDKKFRFYSLYHFICHPITLKAAWKQVRRNKGSAGVDGVTIAMIEQQEGGVERLLVELGEELKSKSYRTQPVLRVYIEKEDGSKRPLGTPTVRDRTVQTAIKLIIEPIFEVDFNDYSFGYRPGKSAHGAIVKIQEHLKNGFTDVYDADLSKCFDMIPHDELIKCVRMRIKDGRTIIN